MLQLYFPSLATTVHKQLEDYSTHQFVSELGGAAGIVLGVSLFTIIKSTNASFYTRTHILVIDDAIDQMGSITRKIKNYLCFQNLQAGAKVSKANGHHYFWSR